MKTVYLIRHGMTAGNREKRYIGRTNEPLCEEGKMQAAKLGAAGFPAFDCIFASPYLRCRETASILFPGAGIAFIEEIRECDFGIFEGKTAAELEGDADYGAWLISTCNAPIPGGESMESFKERCNTAFLEAMVKVPENGSAAFVIHGGSIMAILEACVIPRRAFHEYHIGNCGFVRCAFHDGTLMIEGEGGSVCL